MFEDTLHIIHYTTFNVCTCNVVVCVQWVQVEYFDNKIICDLVDEKHQGILAVLVRLHHYTYALEHSMLYTMFGSICPSHVITCDAYFSTCVCVQDDECLRPGDVSDQTFLVKLIEAVGSHNHFITLVTTTNTVGYTGLGIRLHNRNLLAHGTLYHK